LKTNQHNILLLKLSLLDKEEIRENVLNISLPDVITNIHLEIPPNNTFGYYYSYDGIMEILSNILKMDKKTDKQELRNGDVYVKVYYQNSSIYTLPVLFIDIFFFKELSIQTTDFLKLKIKTDLLVFTNGGGNIEFIKVFDSESVYDLFLLPRSFLYDLNNEILSEYSISQKVRNEMESILLGLVPIMKLDIRTLYDDPDYSVFVEYNNKIEERKTLLYNYL